MRYLVRFSYDGSHFEGFQRLKNQKGVQNEIERVLELLFHQTILIKGAGRTDAHVHALDQCAHFDFSRDIDLQWFLYAFNRLSCPYLSCTSIERVDLNFHARKDVFEKVYVYRIYKGPKNPFLVNYAYFYYANLDISLMQECAKQFMGVHDFQNFVSGKREQFISEISFFQVDVKDGFLQFEVRGKSFYRYMVRNLVGALIDVGSGKCSIQDVSDSLHLLTHKKFSVVPAQGLYLMKISYSFLVFFVIICHII